MTLWMPQQVILPSNLDPIAIQWGPGALFGDTFQPIILAVDHSIQVEGTFAGNTIVQIWGSNDATTINNGNYHPLTDPFANIINMGSAGIHQTTEVTVWVKPAIITGSGSESLTITVAMRRSYR